MTRAVLDTNVLVSAIIKRVGIPNQILKHAGLDFEWLVSKFILTELGIVLLRRHIQTKYKKWVTPTKRTEFLESVEKNAKTVEVSTKLDVVTDPKDNQVLASAVDGQADFLVTGDPHLLKLKNYKGIKIITPAQFHRILTPT